MHLIVIGCESQGLVQTHVKELIGDEHAIFTSKFHPLETTLFETVKAVQAKTTKTPNDCSFFNLIS